jgi:hypothetical protein
LAQTFNELQEAIAKVIADIKNQHDLDDEFYLTYIGVLNDGDISDWFNNHFDDNVELGVGLGQKLEAVRIIDELEFLIKGE